MKNLSLLLLILAICYSHLFAQSVTLEKGKEFEIEAQALNKRGASRETSRFTFYFKVEGKDGVNTKLTCRLVKAAISSQSLTHSQFDDAFDTDSLRNFRLKMMWTMLPLTLLQQSFGVTISPKGELVSLDGIDDIIIANGKKWAFNEGLISDLKNSSKEFPKYDLQKMFPLLPEKPIGYPGGWNSDNVDYKATAINGALLYLNLHTVSAWGNEVNGTAIFNQTTGLVEQLQTREVPGSAGDTVNYTQKLSYGKVIYKTDTAWLNMAMRTNISLSNTFRLNDGFDSVKVRRYFEQNDPVFKNDGAYAINKLNLIQVSTMHGGYDWYSEALQNTPARLLKGNDLHLGNKFRESGKVSVDTTYQVCRYLAPSYAFTEVVQESYSQNFLDWDVEGLRNNEDFKKEIAEKKLTEADVKKMLDGMRTERAVQVKNANALLSLLHADKNPILQQKINPLYLWVIAKNDKEGKILNRATKELSNLSDAEMENGNGGRYSLLVYKLLLNAKKNNDANKLLLKTIEKLERFTNDTLNKNRFVDQNMLAYAYYLRYDEAKNIDTVKALTFLSKAAYYSPENSKQKAYISFYDRAFLNSEESYRELFIEKLFGSGSKEQILKMVAQQITAEPQSVDQMQKLFQAHYPEDDFKVFLASNVLNSWKMAPVFTLKGIDGKEHSLGDYKNKWLIVDFWGTWCPPCKEEMPNINLFNKDIQEGKSSGITLLSVACHDKESNVKGFIKRNNFDIPVAMADENIESLYNISYYPSKVIISPDGKMLSLHSGDDWRAIIKNLNAVYPADKN